MRALIEGRHGDWAQVRSGADVPPAFADEGVWLAVTEGLEDGHAMGLTPARARELAAALLRAADEAEGRA